MAVVVRDAGQSDAYTGRQPEGGFVTDHDLPDLEPRGQPDRRSDARGYGVHPAEGQGDNRIARESAEDRGGSGEAEVLARVHESPGQSRGVPSPEARGTGRGAGYRTQASTEAGAGLDDASLLVSNHKRRPGVPAARRNRPAVWSAPPEASD